MHNPYAGLFPFLDPWPSGDGRFVAFATGANDLVAGDGNGLEDIYLRDRRTGETTRISIGYDGADANGGSLQPSVSADGRYVSFKSYASNLVPGDLDNGPDAFVRDRLTNTTERVSLRSDGQEATAASHETWEPRISADGSTVAFLSSDPDLVPGDTNNTFDVFAYDRGTHVVQRVSTTSDGVQLTAASAHPDVSGDGRYVVFDTTAPGADPAPADVDDDVFVKDRVTGATTLMSSDGAGQNIAGPSGRATISDDGNVVGFESRSTLFITPDKNGTVQDVFLKNRVTGQLTLADRNGNGDQATGGDALGISLDRTGRRVAFESDATDLVTPDPPTRDVYLRDTVSGTTERVNVDNGGSANGGAILPLINATGRYVAFQTDGKLEAADTNAQDDAYLRDAGPNLPPTAAFGVAATTPDAVMVDAASSTDPDGWIVAYRFTFGDGGEASGPVGPHAYAVPGTYTISLTVTDQDGATATTTRTVTVGAKPAADGGGPAPPGPGAVPAPVPAPITPPPPAVKQRLAFAPMHLPLRPDTRGRVAVRLRCASTVRCAGRLTLRVPARGRTKAMTLGSASFAIAGGRTLTVPVKLSATARALLAHRSRLSVRASATAGPTNLATRTLTLARSPNRKGRR